MLAAIEKSRKEGAICIQRYFRGFLVRKCVAQMKEHMNMQVKMDNAARQLQMAWRKAHGR
jgi:hypothetical protein